MFGQAEFQEKRGHTSNEVCPRCHALRSGLQRPKPALKVAQLRPAESVEATFTVRCTKDGDDGGDDDDEEEEEANADADADADADAEGDGDADGDGDGDGEYFIMSSLYSDDCDIGIVVARTYSYWRSFLLPLLSFLWMS